MEMSLSPPPFYQPVAPLRAQEWIARARQFREVAIPLVEAINASPNWPKYFLLGHAIELALKAVPIFFDESGVQRPKCSKPGNHDLVGQYHYAVQCGLRDDLDGGGLLDWLSALHKEHYARYPQEWKPVALPGAFDDLTDRILGAVSELIFGMPARRRSLRL